MTAPNGSRLRAAVQDRATKVAQPPTPEPSKEIVVTRGDEIQSLFDKNRAAMRHALPKHMDVDRMIRIGLTTIRRTPNLQRCTDLSLIGAMMLSAQLGLEPGPLGHCWWLPFKDRRRSRAAKRDVYEVQWIIGYTGIIELARRSGQLLDITAKVVRQRDHYIHEDGMNPTLEFRKYREGDRGELTDVWGLARFKDGGCYSDDLTRFEVETQHRNRSKAWQNAVRNNETNTPWHTDPEAMWRKTMVRVMRPWLPVSIELSAAFAADEGVHHETSFDLDLLADRVLDEDIPDDEPDAPGTIDGEVAPPAETADLPVEEPPGWPNDEPR